MMSKKKKTNNKNIFDYVLTSYVILNILYVFICSYLFTTNKIYYSHYGKSMIGALILNIVFIIVMIIIKKFIKKDLKFKIYDLFLILMAVFAIISCIFAISKKAALFGFYLRYEGVFAILYYFSLVYISSFVKHDHKKILANLIVVTGCIGAIYAYLQINLSEHVKIFYNSGEPLATGFNNNPNFFATNMLLSLSYAIGLYIDSDDILYKVLYGMLIIILMFGLVISNTRSCIVGLFFVVLYVLIFSLKNKRYLDFGIILALIVLVFSYLHFNKMTTLINAFNSTKNETLNLAKGNYNGTYGAKRLDVWKYSLKIAPHYLLHGVGIDNFSFAFGGGPLRVGPYLFDKAHNEYIQILITEGIFALISYLGLIGVALFKGFKNTFKNKEVYLILPVIGYLIQAFFNISVIEVAPIFYISLGLLINRENP